jgi:hypothetical protein
VRRRLTSEIALDPQDAENGLREEYAGRGVTSPANGQRPVPRPSYYPGPNRCVDVLPWTSIARLWPVARGFGSELLDGPR